TFTGKEYRRRGYATILIEKASEELRKKGYDSLCLYVTLENSDAVNLYESLGFYEVPITSVTEVITE
ncbi:MAG TPA: GNAT family N-acetyltransferase, partial [Clostridiaceae bacterium]|nr:GNAT family N-acetyltransferase [Clostridiaceae bacterium]